MPVDLSELSSLGEMLEQLTSRIAKMAEVAAQDLDDTSSPELYAIERALNGASRGVERLVRAKR